MIAAINCFLLAGGILAVNLLIFLFFYFYIIFYFFSFAAFFWIFFLFLALSSFVSFTRPFSFFLLPWGECALL